MNAQMEKKAFDLLVELRKLALDNGDAKTYSLAGRVMDCLLPWNPATDDSDYMFDTGGHRVGG